MNNFENTLVKKIHKIVENVVVSSMRYVEDIFSRELLSQTPISAESVSLNLATYDSKKLNFAYENLNNIEDSSIFKFFKLEDMYYSQVNSDSNDSFEKKPSINFTSKLNIPTMIRCQNCETNFPTKYQYQRHQCEFNAEKVVLKPDADIKDIEKGMRIKYDCTTCGKQFVSKNNLERHQASHENTKNNICEHCNKQFVSENRLRIHKENHCKKAGDISKFYRSDVAVWKCKKCHEVFSSLGTACFHVEICKETLDISENNSDDSNAKENNASNQMFQLEVMRMNSMLPISSGQRYLIDNKNIEKILTEILLQCEFCNRTYADKNLLLMHQRKHTTDKNYECVNCHEIFDSYAVAAQHWLKKCSEFANLFYLPKLTYCEYCDRTFKSHEILYTHKIKKKHYTPKVHLNSSALQSNVGDVNNAKHPDNKDVINKLIEDVLKTLDVPVNKLNAKIAENNEENKENEDPDKNQNIVKIKSETQSESGGSQVATIEADEPEKKKRGRKRKWPKQTAKVKRICAATEDGFKYQCERCIKIFNNVAELESHRDKEHAASFSCEECGQVLHSAKALLIHCRAHKSLKPYVCDTCGRSYSQTSHLWQHMRFHQGIKPFACPHEGCEARYTIRPDLKDHIRKVHTRERPFKCTVCNKCFLTGSVYYQHRLIHTNDRRYGCDVCQKRFFRADALNNHKRIHTDERPYPCGVCGREFRQKGDRNKHLRTQHPDAITTINI